MNADIQWKKKPASTFHLPDYYGYNAPLQQEVFIYFFLPPVLRSILFLQIKKEIKKS